MSGGVVIEVWLVRVAAIKWKEELWDHLLRVLVPGVLAGWPLIIVRRRIRQVFSWRSFHWCARLQLLYLRDFGERWRIEFLIGSFTRFCAIV